MGLPSGASGVDLDRDTTDRDLADRDLADRDLAEVEARLRAQIETATKLARRRERALFYWVLSGAVALAFGLGLVAASAIGLTAAAWGLRVLLAGLLVAMGLLYSRQRPRAWYLSGRIPAALESRSVGQRSLVRSAYSFAKTQEALPTGRSADGMQRHRQPSLSLVRAHLASANKVITPDFYQSRLQTHFAPLEQRVRIAATVAMTALVVVAVFSPTRLSTLFKAAVFLGDAEISTLPLVGDLTLTLKAPTYTKLPPRVISGGDGSIRGLRGTEVVFHAVAEQTLRSAELEFSDHTVPLTVSGGHSVDGQFSLDKSDRYRIILRPLLASAKKEKVGHAVEVENDRAPTVELDDPPSDREVKETDRLLLRYRASDDYGVAALNAVWQVNGAPEQSRPLPEAEKVSGQKSVRGRGPLDLSPLGLKAGDVVTLQIEAKDNNTLFGPSVGRSSVRKLKIFSPEAHRKEWLQRLREMADRMVDALAGELENPFAGEAKAYAVRATSVDDQALAIGRDFLQVAEGLKESPTSRDFSRAAERAGSDFLALYPRKKKADAALGQSAAVLATSDAKAGTAAALKRDAVALLERSIMYFEEFAGPRNPRRGQSARQRFTEKRRRIAWAARRIQKKRRRKTQGTDCREDFCDQGANARHSRQDGEPGKKCRRGL